MSRRSTSALLVLVAIPILAACQVSGFRAPSAPRTARAELTTIVADLRMHLEDDTYRAPRARTESGQTVFENLLWRVDRLETARTDAAAADTDVDAVLAYSRARVLERLRRYEAAAEAFASVAAGDSLLGAPAEAAARVMQRFASIGGLATPGAAPSEAVDERTRIERRIAAWRQMAAEHADTPYAPLAFEEAEAWEVMRVSLIARRGSPREAIAACKELVEHNRASKLRPQHFLRLGDLYAAAARSEDVISRAARSPFDIAQYDVFMERAFAAYELAREARRPISRREAATRIEALLAYHEGVRDRVR